jgi:hypothetical protein
MPRDVKLKTVGQLSWATPAPDACDKYNHLRWMYNAAVGVLAELCQVNIITMF